MKSHFLLLVLLQLSLAGSRGADKWSAELNMAHACCCNPICPCIVGSPPTRGDCHDNMLVEIKRGEFNGVRLNGIAIAMTEEMRKWKRLYVSDRATPEQTDAAVALLKQIPLFAGAPVLSVERVPVTINRTASRIEFSTPVSQVEIEPLKGKNGKPVTVQNTPLPNYVQYHSIKHSYQGKDMQFNYTNTQAATWTIKASSKDRKPEPKH